MMSSNEVPNNLFQDSSIPVGIIGTNVVSLYPNLRWEAAGEEIYRSIMDTSIEFKGLNYKEGCLRSKM